MRRLVIGMSGATGAIFGVRLLEALKPTDVQTHLVASKWALQTVAHETGLPHDQLCALADQVHGAGDMGAAISSGSFLTEGMVVVPCSMSSLAAIAGGHGTTLVHRAADVVLKERRKLVLVTRETPLSDIHLENMLKLSRMGAVILPPMPAFYNHPANLDEMIDHIVTRILDQFGLAADSARRWDGVMKRPTGAG